MFNSQVLKIISCISFLLASLTILKAQDTIQKVNINNFEGILVKSGIDVILTQSNEEKIEIRGLKTFAEDITVTKNDSGVVKFEMHKFTLKNWKWGKNQSLKIYVSFKNLKKIKLSECATILADSVLTLDTLNVKIDDGSDIKLNLNAKSLNLVIENGSNIHLYGNVKNFNLIGTNASSVKAFNLVSTNLFAWLYNGTDAELFANEYLSIVAKNGSDAVYKGNPTKKIFKTETYSTIKKVK